MCFAPDEHHLHLSQSKRNLASHEVPRHRIKGVNGNHRASFRPFLLKTGSPPHSLLRPVFNFHPQWHPTLLCSLRLMNRSVSFACRGSMVRSFSDAPVVPLRRRADWSICECHVRFIPSSSLPIAKTSTIGSLG
jgi:hypothetical protein